LNQKLIHAQCSYSQQTIIQCGEVRNGRGGAKPKVGGRLCALFSVVDQAHAETDPFGGAFAHHIDITLLKNS